MVEGQCSISAAFCSRDAIVDLMENNHLWFFPSTDGFGTINVITDNPLLEPTEFKVGDYV